MSTMQATKTTQDRFCLTSRKWARTAGISFVICGSSSHHLPWICLVQIFIYAHFLSGNLWIQFMGGKKGKKNKRTKAWSDSSKVFIFLYENDMHVCINGKLWEKGIAHEDRWLPVMAFPSVPELIASNQLSDIAQTQLKGMHSSRVHWSVRGESCKE